MDFQVAWTRLAPADLRDLVRYIAKDDPESARRFGNRIIAQIDGLIRFPRAGRIVPEYREDGLREMIVSPYRIVYEIDESARRLAILRVWHGARGDLELPR